MGKGKGGKGEGEFIFTLSLLLKTQVSGLSEKKYAYY
jgi:hypothetical protein